MTGIILTVAASFMIACLGRNKRFGFWGYFFGSLLLTPFVGLILMLASDKISKKVMVS